MHLMITYVLLGIAMLTGEVVAIPLRDLEQSGCLEFRVSLFSTCLSSDPQLCTGQMMAACSKLLCIILSRTG